MATSASPYRAIEISESLGGSFPPRRTPLKRRAKRAAREEYLHLPTARAVLRHSMSVNLSGREKMSLRFAFVAIMTGFVACSSSHTANSDSNSQNVTRGGPCANVSCATSGTPTQSCAGEGTPSAPFVVCACDGKSPRATLAATCDKDLICFDDGQGGAFCKGSAVAINPCAGMQCEGPADLGKKTCGGTGTTADPFVVCNCASQPGAPTPSAIVEEECAGSQICFDDGVGDAFCKGGAAPPGH
jgi:hypothetical protein